MLGVNSINLGKLEFCAHYIYDEHAHNEYEINYINLGRCIMVIDDKNVTLKQGECVIIPPNYRHSFMVDGLQKCQITQLSFKLYKIDEVLDSLSLFKYKQPYFKITNCTDVLDSMSQMYTYYNYKSYSEYNKLLLNLELQKLFVMLSMHIEHTDLKKGRYEHTLLETALAYIDAHYEEDIQLEDLAKMYKVSSRYLRKIFMEYVGFSAIEYITMLRIERAKDLLKNTHSSISEIGMDVGYNSFQYFSMMFKKKTGVSPKDFRGQYRM